MEIGNEISQKIRSAIKAKLVDLGAYVDDELPDYIMVMVANKKSTQQMAEDLTLFLGSNTHKFTSWLSGLLEKLQSIGTSGAGTNSESSNKPAASSETSKSQKTLERSTSHEQKKEGGKTQKNALGKADTVEEDLIKITTEDVDEFDDEVPDAGPAAKKRKSSTSASAQSKPAFAAAAAPKETAPTPEEPPPKKASTESVIGNATRKRKLGSTVGAVLKHDIYSDDEEYDPHKPSIGKVASVVKVTERKSSVPVALQANRALLLKAMSEAHSSVEKAKKTQSSQGPRASETRREGIKSRLGSQPRRPSPRWNSRDPPRRAPLQRVELRSREQRRVTSRKESEEAFTERKREEILGKLKQEALESRKERAKEKERRSLEDVESLVLSEKDEVELDQEILRLNAPEEDSRLIQCTSPLPHFDDDEDLDTMIQSGAEDSEFAHSDSEEIILHANVHSRLSPRRAESPKFVVTLDRVEQSLLNKPINFDSDVDMEDETTLGNAGFSQQGEQKSTAAQAGASVRASDAGDGSTEMTDAASNQEGKLEKCRFYPSCKNGDECPFYHPTAPCSNFPNCRFGDKCLYIHPPCRFDSNCTRLNCAYAHSTTRPRAPAFSMAPTVIVQPIKVPVYTRPPAPKPPRPPAPKHPSQVTCRFFPKCTNMDCPFFHPRPCRFGIGCNSKATCQFLHPDLPNRKSLKWHSDQTTDAETSTDYKDALNSQVPIMTN